MSENLRQCLVTGASGFIGRTLCLRLQQGGCKVRALLRHYADGPWDEVVLGELGRGDLPFELLQGIDTVFHLAGIAHRMASDETDTTNYYVVNSKGSEALARASAGAGTRRFIYFSSVKAVANPGEGCIDENWEAAPVGAYGLSKRRAEERVLGIGSRHGMHVSVLRPTLVYGPGVKGNLRRMLHAIDVGRFPPLPDVGNRRSMVHVDDLANAAWLAATCPDAAGHIYIVSDGQEYSTRQLYEWMCKTLGRKTSSWTLPILPLRTAAHCGDVLEKLFNRRLPLNTEVLHQLLGSACYRSDKLQSELGWQPQRTFREALPEMVEEYRRS